MANDPVTRFPDYPTIMKLSLLQDTIAWADKQANLRRVESQLEQLAGQTDLVVLPEMFTTGFCTGRLDLAEDMQGVTVQTIRRWATDFGLALSGSFLATEDGRYYNRAFFIRPDGEMYTADKRHLFAPGGESRLLSPGDKRLIVPYKGFNICVLVCYDLRFPVWSRNVDNAYDLLLYVANWPAVRIHTWHVLLEARAMENLAYVCGVNRTGEDGDGLAYNGGSKVIDAKGGVMLALPDNQTAVATVELSKESLERVRTKFPVWKDADKFVL